LLSELPLDDDYLSAQCVRFCRCAPSECNAYSTVGLDCHSRRLSVLHEVLIMNFWANGASNLGVHLTFVGRTFFSD